MKFVAIDLRIYFILIFLFPLTPNTAFAVELGDKVYVQDGAIYNFKTNQPDSVPVWAEISIDDLKGKKVRGTVQNFFTRHPFNGGIEKAGGIGANNFFKARSYKLDQSYWFDISKIVPAIPKLSYEIYVYMGDGKCMAESKFNEMKKISKEARAEFVSKNTVNEIHGSCP